MLEDYLERRLRAWRQAWRRRFQSFWETVTNPYFWAMLFGVVAALVVWVYLFYLAIKHADTSLGVQSTFCDTLAQRDRHLLALILLTPLFLVGMLGVIGEWMTIMEDRRKRRKSQYRPFVAFAVLMQVTAVGIYIALQC